MTALATITDHLRATHNPAALAAYEAEKRRTANENAMQDYLAVASAPHESGCLSRRVGTVEWCSCRRRRLLKEATRRYREAWGG